MLISFNNQGWLAKLYRFTFTTYYELPLPSNLCPFFWSTAFAVAVFPLTVIGHLFHKTGISKDIPKVIIGLLSPLILFAILAFGIALIITAPFFLSRKLFRNKIRKQSQDKPSFFTEVATLVKTKAYAAYHKVCPAIEWK